MYQALFQTLNKYVKSFHSHSSYMNKLLNISISQEKILSLLSEMLSNSPKMTQLMAGLRFEPRSLWLHHEFQKWLFTQF